MTGFLELGLAAGLLLAPLCARAAPPLAGRTMPAFGARLLDGGVFDAARMKGKVVLVVFWSAGCPSCRDEMAALEQCYRRHREDGLEIVAVSVDDPRGEAEVLAAMRAFSYPAAMAADADIAGFGPVGAVPLRFVIDRRGVLRKGNWGGGDGKPDAAALARVIGPLLRER